METPFNLCVPAAKHIVISGDIHGDFNTLVHKLCVQYKMQDTLLIVAGDCGFGFEKPATKQFLEWEGESQLTECHELRSGNNIIISIGNFFILPTIRRLPEISIGKMSHLCLMKQFWNLSGRNTQLIQ